MQCPDGGGEGLAGGVGGVQVTAVTDAGGREGESAVDAQPDLLQYRAGREEAFGVGGVQGGVAAVVGGGVSGGESEAPARSRAVSRAVSTAMAVRPVR